MKCISLSIFLLMMTLVHCIPIEIVYTGDSCDCATKLDYAVNVPKVPRQRKYYRNDYGYKLDLPVQSKAKVSYSFDFVVEEPKTPKPQPGSKWNLYAKVDRVAVNKPDCESSRKTSCKYEGRHMPGYRYVYNRMPPYSYPAKRCKCHSHNQLNSNPNAIDNANFMYISDDNNNDHITAGRRLKRDLYRNLFRPRKAAAERSGRFIKLYSKNIPSRPIDNIFALDTIIEPLDKTMSMKRKLKKAYFPRLVKRDIKGEYDLLEKDREQIDLTLPEIIQFMPETLQPSFKRGQCIFGDSCFKTVVLKQSGKTSYHKNTHKHVTNKNTAEENDTAMKSDIAYARKMPKKTNEKSKMTTTFKKRNAANYDYESIPFQSTPVKARNDASDAESKSSLANNQPFADSANDCITKPTLSQFASTSGTLNDKLAELPQTLQPSPYEISHVNTKTDKVITPTGYLPINSQSYVPYKSDVTPSFRYAPDEYSGSVDDVNILPVTGRQFSKTQPYVHPLQHISNAEMDKIVSDIVYKHPEFIDATYHFGGTSIDPEPLQEQQVRDFLKQLIDGRLNLWFKEEKSHTPLYYISCYDNPSITY